MGVDCVSSDEELPRSPGEKVRFKTYRKHFLSAELSQLVHYIDDLGARSGHPDRYARIPSGQTSVGRRIVTGLHWNAYDAAWYIGLKRTDREIVGALIEEYVFHDRVYV